MKPRKTRQETRQTSTVLMRIPIVGPAVAALLGHGPASEGEAFISLLRQAAALLHAGRTPSTVWAELAELHPPCLTVASDTVETNNDSHHPSCCLHHVLAAQQVNALVGKPLFATVTGPGHGRYWAQLAGCLQVSQETGLPLAPLLDRLADALDAGEDAHQARQAAAAGPRSTAQLLSFLPVAGLGLSAMMGTTIFDLLSHVGGWVLLAVGLSLAVGGRIWTSRLVRSAEQL